MADIRLHIPDELIQKFQTRLGPDIQATEIAREAITLLNWAYEQRAQGYFILSMDPSGTPKGRLEMPLLEKAAPSPA